MPPLLPDEATKAQETFRLGDRFYVEEHGLVLGELIGVATAKKDGLMPMEQFFDRDVNPIEDYNTFTWNGIRKTTKSTSNSPFESGDGQNAVIFIGTNDVQKIGFQATYSGQLIKIRLYWVGSWGKWQTFSLT